MRYAEEILLSYKLQSMTLILTFMVIVNFVNC